MSKKQTLKYEEMGKRVTEARESLDISKADMIRMLGWDETSPRYGYYESGRSKMPPEVMKEFCRLTGYNSEYLIYGTGPKKGRELSELIAEVEALELVDKPSIQLALNTIKEEVERSKKDKL